MAKNFGLNIDLISDKPFKRVEAKTRSIDILAKTAKRDFASYARVEKKAETQKDILTCKTYLCNWQGLTILGSTCPVCGQPLTKVNRR